MTRLTAFPLLVAFMVGGGQGQTTIPVQVIQQALETASRSTNKVIKLETISQPSQDIVPHIIVLSEDEGSRPHLLVFKYSGTALKEAWNSGPLPVEFSVHSASGFEIQRLQEEAIIVFQGCAPHDCGGTGDLGMLLYSTANDVAFFAHSVGASGAWTPRQFSVTYSSNVNAPRYRDYKELLEKLLKVEQDR